MKFLIHAACKLVNFLFYSNLSQTCCGFFRAIETIISIAADVQGDKAYGVWCVVYGDGNGVFDWPHQVTCLQFLMGRSVDRLSTHITF